MTTQKVISRRDVLRLAVAVGGLAATANVTSALAQALRRTPGQILGPFYPVTRPSYVGSDLTALPGKRGHAAGQIIHVMGKILDPEGKPVPGAKLEIWQANTYGRYAHPSDTNPAPLDPNFEGFAVLSSDAQGRYRFKTIKPGAYPAGAGLVRPPHIHFEVTSKSNRLVTQMYFAGEPLNDKDPYLQSAGANKERLIVPLAQPTKDTEPDSMIAQWDIVIDNV